jgi:hypothetical protein
MYISVVGSEGIKEHMKGLVRGKYACYPMVDLLVRCDCISRYGLSDIRFQCFGKAIRPVFTRLSIMYLYN